MKRGSFVVSPKKIVDGMLANSRQSAPSWAGGGIICPDVNTILKRGNGEVIIRRCERLGINAYMEKLEMYDRFLFARTAEKIIPEEMRSLTQKEAVYFNPLLRGDVESAENRRLLEKLISELLEKGFVFDRFEYNAGVLPEDQVVISGEVSP